MAVTQAAIGGGDQIPPLLAHHRAMIEASGITAEVAAARRYQSVTKEGLLALSFKEYQALEGFLIPMWNVRGEIGNYQVRPDKPRVRAKGKKPIKYETIEGHELMVDVHPFCLKYLSDVSKALWLTEGVKKGDSIVSAGAFAAALTGVHNFRGTTAKGKAVLPDFEYITWPGRIVYIAFDSDFATNVGVRDAMIRIGKLVEEWGGTVMYVRIPSEEGSKVGIDDYLAGGGTLAELAASHSSPIPPSRDAASEFVVDESAFTGEESKSLPEGRVFSNTDLGNAERLVAMFGDDIRYCATLRRWISWDGRRWLVDEHDGAPIYQLAARVVRAMYIQASKIKDDEKRKAEIAWAFKTEARRALENMIVLAKTLPGVAITVDDLDTNPNLLNVANATINLETFELYAHRREDLITRIIDIPYDAEAECPQWEGFLDMTFQGNDALCNFVWKACGYSLTGNVAEKCLFYLHGNEGDNGKSVFINILSGILGDYASATPTETLLAKGAEGSIPNDLARLKGKRFVAASEVGEGKRLNEELTKQLTGNDKISARFMRAEWFDFRPVFKIWMTGNYLPIIRGQDKAIWNRFVLIDFGYSVPKEKQIKDFDAKMLREEGPGILKWMIDGCIVWRQEGLGRPSTIKESVDKYREDMDDLGEFLRQCTVVEEGSSVGAARIYSVYEKWCGLNGIKSITSTAFGRRLTERRFVKQKTMTGAVYQGLRVPDDETLDRVYRGGE